MPAGAPREPIGQGSRHGFRGRSRDDVAALVVFRAACPLPQDHAVAVLAQTVCGGDGHQRRGVPVTGEPGLVAPGIRVGVLGVRLERPVGAHHRHLRRAALLGGLVVYRGLGDAGLHLHEVTPLIGIELEAGRAGYRQRRQGCRGAFLLRGRHRRRIVDCPVGCYVAGVHARPVLHPGLQAEVG